MAGIVFQLALQFYLLTKILGTQNNVKAVGDKGLLECHVIRAQNLTLTLGSEKKGVMWKCLSMFNTGVSALSNMTKFGKRGVARRECFQISDFKP